MTDRSDSRIDTITALERVVGKTPPPVKLKVIDHLDAHALRWLAQSPLAFTAFARADSTRGHGGAGTHAEDTEQTAIGITLAGGRAGFAAGERGILQLPLAALDQPGLARAGQSFGSLFLVPGVGETLRVNGRVAAVDGESARIVIEECYLHCAKALIRSEFWAAVPPRSALDEAIPDDAVSNGAGADDPTGFVAASRFLALATVDANGRADVSPKGDPAGAMAQLDESGLLFADRPGNRRVDSFRNIVSQPAIAGVLLIPGSTRVALVHGNAALSDHASLRQRFTVQGKTPLLTICVEQPGIELIESPALRRAGLWPAADRPADIDPAKIFADHVRLNRDQGLTAKIAGAVVSIPGLMRKGLEKDYDNNLY